MIALTVPTWAPVLAVNLPQENGWRASRADNCSDLLTQTAQTTVGIDAVQVPLPDGSRHLHGDAHRDAGRAESAGRREERRDSGSPGAPAGAPAPQQAPGFSSQKLW